MKEYFSLQFKMANRKLIELGFPPAAGYILCIASFLLLSEYMFLKTGFAKYLVVFIALSFMSKASDKSRTEFLESVFGSRKSRTIRITENLIISLPFLVSLVYHQAFPESCCLLAGSVILASLSFRTSSNFTLPTPFSRKPFEFAAGFRKTIFIFPLAYILTFIAMSVQNLNLGIFAMLLILLLSITYYVKPEHEYFVWSYSVSPSAFLFRKMSTATQYSILSALPSAAILCAFYPYETGFILLFLFIGLTFLWTTILAKYSVYPDEINLPEIVLIIVSILFPPLLLFLLPYFYIKSVKTLNSILK